MRNAYRYKENYLTMFKKSLFNEPEYEAILQKLESIENPITFYITLKEMQYGEKISDIKTMYYEGHKLINIMAKELGIQEEDLEDYEIEEGE